MIVAISGVPGTGKTTACKMLECNGYNVVYINKLISVHPEFVTGYDKKRKVKEVEVGKLKKYIKYHYSRTSLTFVDSHYSHLLGPDVIIILRCDPKELINRLKKKRFRKEKIMENIEAEALDVITIESVQVKGKDNVYEIDITNLSTIKIVEAIKKIIETGTKNYSVGKLDWSEEVLEWY